ncbi:MAG: PriCT-2 domain-containing protein [Gammaproteobacteria bacterium]|nr:PriCT-2 domain-containing protein [Gammaproteobacteria bacterium]
MNSQPSTAPSHSRDPLEPVDPGGVSPPCEPIAPIPQSFGDAALFWHVFGLQPIPVVPKGKKPAVKFEPWLSNLSQSAILRYWERHPDHELAHVVGNRLLVLDADGPSAEQALLEIEAGFGIAPRLCIRTKRGVHHYFCLAAGTVARACGHDTDKHPHRIDTRTGQSIAVLPPSTNKSLEKLDARNVDHLSEVGQDFVDAIVKHNGGAPSHSALPRHPPSSQKLVGSPINLLSVKRLLEVIPDPDIGYSDWITVLMVVHTESGGSDDGLALAVEWSARGEKFKGRAEIEAKWRSFDNSTPRRVGLLTLAAMVEARGHDWLDACHGGSGFEPCAFERVYVDLHPKVTH